MPVYSFYRLPNLEGEPLRAAFFADDAAGRYALGTSFSEGCDLWQGSRFVGRFHGQRAANSDLVEPS